MNACMHESGILNRLASFLCFRSFVYLMEVELCFSYVQFNRGAFARLAKRTQGGSFVQQGRRRVLYHVLSKTFYSNSFS